LTRALPATWAVVVAITAGFAVVAWSGVEQFKSAGGDDEVAFRSYVDGLSANHRLPGPSENAEYSLPPGIPALGVALNWAFKPIKPDRPSPVLQNLPRLLRRLLWLALVAGGAALIARAPPLAPRWLIGLGAWVAAGGWSWAYVNAAVDNEAWLPLVLIDLVSAIALVPLTAWLAHELWPRWRWAAPLGALGATLLPAVFAGSLYFHPDPPFAALAVLSTALVLRAARTGLTIGSGIAAGIALGAAALARQSGPLIAVSLLAGVLLVARRGAWRYSAAAAVALVVVAGPWWYHQLALYGNPVQSNLERPGRMLDHQPVSFYVSFPAELVTSPRFDHFQNELLPRFHAFLWSDWSGGYHHGWESPKRHATTLASVQSVLGFGGDALVLGGLVLLGLPALARARRRTHSDAEAGLAILSVLFVVSWAAYVTTLIRFPQRDGDPIKVHYLLFLGPVSVAFAIAAGVALARRGGWARAALVAWIAAYAVSWALTLATAF
jgi:4-amino-4-deoxy-L-arabinose transferase-like glycosyltransferase